MAILTGRPATIFWADKVEKPRLVERPSKIIGIRILETKEVEVIRES
jgi:hypothetical protein